MLRIVLTSLAVWTVLSIPVALVLGKILSFCSRHDRITAVTGDRDERGFQAAA